MQGYSLGATSASGTGAGAATTPLASPLPMDRYGVAPLPSGTVDLRPEAGDAGIAAAVAAAMDAAFEATFPAGGNATAAAGASSAGGRGAELQRLLGLQERVSGLRRSLDASLARIEVDVARCVRALVAQAPLPGGP